MKKQMPNMLIWILLLTIGVGSVLYVSQAPLQTSIGLNQTFPRDEKATQINLPAIGKVDTQKDGTNIASVTVASSAIFAILQKATNILFGFAGVVALFFIIYSGAMLIMTRGEEEAIKKAHETLLWAIVGFLLVIVSFGLVVGVGNIIYAWLS